MKISLKFKYLLDIKMTKENYRIYYGKMNYTSDMYSSLWMHVEILIYQQGRDLNPCIHLWK